MDLDIRWDNQHPGVIVMKYDQPATWDEVLEIFDVQARMAAEVTYPVAVIVLQHPSIHLPGPDWLATLRQLMRGQPPNVKVWIGVGMNRTLQAVVEVVRRTGLMNSHTAPSFEEARQMADTFLSELEANASDLPG